MNEPKVPRYNTHISQLCLRLKMAACAAKEALASAMSFMPNQAASAVSAIHGTQMKAAFCVHTCTVWPFLTMVWPSPPKMPKMPAVTTSGLRNCTTETPKLPRPAFTPNAEPLRCGQPEQLVGRILEAQARQAHGNHAPDLPDGKGQEQRGHRDPQVELGDGFAFALPERFVLRSPEGEQTPLAPTGGCGRHGVSLESESSAASRSSRCCLRGHQIGAAHFGEVHPDERDPHHAVHQHESAGADAGEVHQRAEQDGQDEAAHATGQAHDAADGTDVLGVVVADVLEDTGLAKGPGNAQQKHEAREQVHIQADVKGLGAVDGDYGEVGLRVAQQKQA